MANFKSWQDQLASSEASDKHLLMVGSILGRNRRGPNVDYLSQAYRYRYYVQISYD